MSHAPWPCIRKGVLLLGFFCVTLEAQMRPAAPALPPRRLNVSDVVVVMDSSCAAIQNLVLIVNDYDRYEYPLTARDGEWRVTTPDNNFDAADAHASLRSPNMRSDCVPASEPQWEERRAVFRFGECSTRAVRHVVVSASSAITISYVRPLKPGDSGTVPCKHLGSFSTNEKRTVRAVRDEDEDLVLQLGLQQPRPDLDGVRLSEVLRLIKGVKEGAEVHLPPDRTIRVLTVQRARGRAGVPNLSSVAIDLDRGMLRGIGDPTLVLAMEKIERKAQ